MTKEKKSKGKLKRVARNINFQRAFLAIFTVMVIFFIIFSGAMPKKYKLNLGDISTYDITAPRDVVNETLTEKNRQTAAESVQPVTKEDTKTFFNVINKKDNFFKVIKNARNSVTTRMNIIGVTSDSNTYSTYLAESQTMAANTLAADISNQGIQLSQDQVNYLVVKLDDSMLEVFEDLTRQLLADSMSEGITESNFAIHLQSIQNSFKSNPNISTELKAIGSQLTQSILEPNRKVDLEATEIKRNEAKNDPANIIKIKKGSRIISVGEVVAEDKYNILDELNLLETNRKFDYVFALGVFSTILFLAVLSIFFIKKYNKHIYKSIKDLILISSIVILVIAVSRYIYPYFDGLAIPVFVGTMLIAILMNVELAVVLNFSMTIAISLMLKGDYKFLYLGLICGVIAAYLATRTHQRSRLSMNGAVLGFISVIFIVGYNLFQKADSTTIITESIIVFCNGIISMVFTIGLLPFLETTFNIASPLKLLELTNSNHPLLKRLLMEAPGTYHHSIMVGNLAEVATESIGGDALLSRVGAFFHDVGKLKRPDFFKENQLSDNPHDRMTPALSTLVITSHVKDGLEIANKYKLPLVIKDIIVQHHGTTLVAYFYHKAINSRVDGDNEIKQEDFRYAGPRPQTKEAAVVMMADSVEAAVRSMPDKTEEKISALIRKIIKDKLDDGQLDMCDLTLKDLDVIANSFVKVLSGYFHAREQYPEITKKEVFLEDKEHFNTLDNTQQGGEKVDINRK